MDKKNFTIIETEKQQKTKPAARQTNPIVKKFVEFQKENLSQFSVKDLFKN